MAWNLTSFAYPGNSYKPDSEKLSRPSNLQQLLRSTKPNNQDSKEDDNPPKIVTSPDSNSPPKIATIPDANSPLKIATIPDAIKSTTPDIDGMIDYVVYR